MNTLKKALFICFGITFFTVGIAIVIGSMLVINFDASQKIMGVLGGLFLTLFGWWLLRRESNSVWDAITWIFANI